MGLTAASWSWWNRDRSRIIKYFRKDFVLSEPRGAICPQNARFFLNELKKLQGKSAIAESVRGPTDWESLKRKHREVLNISLDPPETKRILLKTKKFVNACLR